MVTEDRQRVIERNPFDHERCCMESSEQYIFRGSMKIYRFVWVLVGVGMETQATGETQLHDPM